jgi:hypothetical protein
MKTLRRMHMTAAPDMGLVSHNRCCQRGRPSGPGRLSPFLSISEWLIYSSDETFERF